MKFLKRIWKALKLAWKLSTTDNNLLEDVQKFRDRAEKRNKEDQYLKEASEQIVASILPPNRHENDGFDKLSVVFKSSHTIGSLEADTILDESKNNFKYPDQNDQSVQKRLEEINDKVRERENRMGGFYRS